MKIIYMTLLLFPLMVMAQSKKTTSGADATSQQTLELELDLGFGQSTLLDPAEGFDASADFSYQLGLKANYYLNRYFGFSLGIGFTEMNTEVTNPMYRDIIDSGTDPTGDYELIFYAPDYLETQKVKLFTVPIHVLGKIPFHEKWYVRGAVGIEFGFDTDSEYHLESGVCTRLYYPDLMANEDEAICGIPEWGLNEDDKSCDGSVGYLDHETSIALSTQLLVGYQINAQIAIQLGGYWNYGLNEHTENNQEKLMIGHIPGFCYNSYKTVYDDQNMRYGFSIGAVYQFKK